MKMDLARFQEIAQPGQSLETLSTPRPVIDEDRLAANIQRVQAYMDSHGISFRPHIKTHKIPALAEAQVKAGARGINCQKITEAEVFAAAGFDDILITFNILGREKLDRLAALHARIGGLKVVADSAVTIDGLSAAFSASKPLAVLVECDTGGGRCGVQTPEEAQALAVKIGDVPERIFAGLLTYPSRVVMPRFKVSLKGRWISSAKPGSPARSSAMAARRASSTRISCLQRPNIGPGPISTMTARWSAPAIAARTIAPCTFWRPWSLVPQTIAP